MSSWTVVKSPSKTAVCVTARERAVVLIPRVMEFQVAIWEYQIAFQNVRVQQPVGVGKTGQVRGHIRGQVDKKRTFLFWRGHEKFNMDIKEYIRVMIS